MKSTHEIAKRFREVILNGTWIANTNYKDQLNNLDWKIATTQFQSLNTIAILAQHIHYYIKGINNVFKGGTLDIKDKFSFDFPPIESQSDWNNFLSIFWTDAELFATLIEQMPDEKPFEAGLNSVPKIEMKIILMNVWMNKKKQITAIQPSYMIDGRII